MCVELEMCVTVCVLFVGSSHIFHMLMPYSLWFICMSVCVPVFLNNMHVYREPDIPIKISLKEPIE